jgi:hypothetical protein
MNQEEEKKFFHQSEKTRKIYMEAKNRFKKGTQYHR